MKTPRTNVHWEIVIRIMHFELCAKSSAHTETPRRGMTLFIFYVSPVFPCGGNLSNHERADKDTAQPPHRFPHVTGPTLHIPYLPQFLVSLLSRVGHCVQLQELLLRSHSVPCRFNLLYCCLCCKALYQSFKSALSHMLSLLYWCLQVN